MKEEKIRVLSDREHLLKLPGMYIGSMSNEEFDEFILEDEKLIKKKISYVPSLLKIINEAIDNSLDEAVKTDFKFGNKISVSIDKNLISIEDNGRGIPVKKAEGASTFMPVLAFCNARAGSNFDKENSSSIGTHGLGIKATNIFSKIFEVSTSDGENQLNLRCLNNMESISFTTKKSKRHFTKIKFKPDLSRFGLTEITENHIKMIEQRLLFLSISFPKVNFIFNGKKISINNNKQFMSLFSKDYELISGNNWFIGIYPNTEEDFSFFSYVNGLYLKRGGNHINLISNEISYRLRDILAKKYKTIKPGDVKNKISLVVFFTNFGNMKFDSQTKETLNNSGSEIKKFMDIQSDDFDNIAKSLSKNKEIVEPIIEMFRIKEEYKKRQALKNISKKSKKITSDAYFAPIGKKKYLFLTEGFSATSSMLKILGRRDIAYYSLRGKPLNTYDSTITKLIKNKEFKEITDILNINLLDKESDMDFEKVIFLSDSDMDGIHIRSLLLTFFSKFTPKLLEEGRIGYMETPSIIAFDNNKKPIKWFFNIDDYLVSSNDKILKNKTIKYYKGLGSFSGNELKTVIKTVGQMEDLFMIYTHDDVSNLSIENWMSKENSDYRKLSLKDRPFNLSVT